MLLQIFGSYLSIAIASVLVGIIVLFAWTVLPPRHPRGIPAVPFWLTLLPFFYDVDQEETYRKYLQRPLREHGAVKIFFGGQWNLLVHRSSYVMEMFRNEDIYHKSGNQKKIPHSVLADFLGDNIISSRDENWKLYREVIKPGLQTEFDAQPLIDNAWRLCSMLASSQKVQGNSRGLLIQDFISRYTTANVAGGILQTDIGTLTESNSTFHNLQKQVRMEIFKPVFMNFPFLDQLGNWIPSRVHARQVVSRFSHEIQSRLFASHAGLSCTLSSENPKLGSRLIAARDSGELSEKQFRDNLNVVITAGQENPQLLVISMLYLLAKYPNVQHQLRQSILAVGQPSNMPPDELKSKLADLPYLTGTIYEALRMFPPISQLINRRVSQPTYLGNEHFIPEGTYVGYHCYSTNRDPESWGSDAGEFKPERWGDSEESINKLYRAKRVRGEFISFHGGKRACLGEKFAVLEMRVTLAALLEKFKWKLDETWEDKKTPAGPLYPRALRLVFKERDDQSYNKKQSLTEKAGMKMATTTITLPSGLVADEKKEETQHLPTAHDLVTS